MLAEDERKHGLKEERGTDRRKRTKKKKLFCQSRSGTFAVMLLSGAAYLVLALTLLSPAAPHPHPAPQPTADGGGNDGLTSADFSMRLSHKGQVTPDMDLLREGDTLR